MDEETENTTAPISPADRLAETVTRVAASGGWEQAAAVVSRHWDRYVTTEPGALLDAIKALPGEALVRTPSLLVATNYLQHVLVGGDPRRFHDSAYDDHGHPVPGAKPLDRLIGMTGRAAGHRTAGRLEAARQKAIEAQQLLERLSDADRAELREPLPHLLTQWARALELTDSGGAREYEEAWDLATLTGQDLAARRAAASLAWLHVDHGRLNEAQLWIDRARQSGTANPRYDAPLYIAAAFLATDRLDAQRASAELTALETVPAGEHWAAALWARAWHTETREQAVLLDQQIDHEVSRQPGQLAQDGANRRYLTAARARLSTLQGNPLRLEPALTDDGSAFSRVMAAADAYTTGQNHIVLRDAKAAAKAGHRPRLQASALLLTAAARYGLARHEAAAHAFGSAHAIIEHEGLHNAYSIIAPAHLAALFALTGLSTRPEVLARHGDPARPSPTVVLSSLTRRERDVLSQLTTDHSFTTIARELYISPNTVKTIARGLYRKLGVHSRTEAADIAHQAGIR